MTLFWDLFEDVLRIFEGNYKGPNAKISLNRQNPCLNPCQIQKW